MLKSHQFRLAIRPVGEPRDGDFELAEADLPPLGPGQVLLRTIYLSLDPYMRSRMKNVKSYAAPWQVGEVLPGGTALLLGFVMQLGATGNLVGIYLGSVLQEVGVTDALGTGVLPDRPLARADPSTASSAGTGSVRAAGFPRLPSPNTTTAALCRLPDIGHVRPGHDYRARLAHEVTSRARHSGPFAGQRDTSRGLRVRSRRLPRPVRACLLRRDAIAARPRPYSANQRGSGHAPPTPVHSARLRSPTRRNPGCSTRLFRRSDADRVRRLATAPFEMVVISRGGVFENCHHEARPLKFMRGLVRPSQLGLVFGFASRDPERYGDCQDRSERPSPLPESTPRVLVVQPPGRQCADSHDHSARDGFDPASPDHRAHARHAPCDSRRGLFRRSMLPVRTSASFPARTPPPLRHAASGDRFRRRDCFAQRGSDRRRSFRGSRADGIRRPFEPDLEYVCPLASAISFPVR